LLKLDDQLDPDRIDIADRFYNAGTETLINAVRELPNDCQVPWSSATPRRTRGGGVRAD
jgi:hypothetical protein